MENNGKGIFYGVIGVATLIVAIIGATFAYFTASAPENNSVIKGQTATSASISLRVEQVLPAATDLKGLSGRMVPIQDKDEGSGDDAVTNLLPTALKRGCVDSNGYVACQVYKVTVSNTAEGSDAVRTAASVQLTDFNTIENLKWQRLTAMPTAEADNLDATHNAVTNHAGKTLLQQNTDGLEYGTDDVWYFVVWLANNGDQTETDAAETFGGTVSVNMVNLDGTEAGNLQATFK